MKSERVETKVKAQKKKSIGARMAEDQFPFFTSYFENVSVGVEFSLTWLAKQVPRTIVELKTKFTAGELSALIDVHNSHMLSPYMCGPRHLALMIEDSELDALPAKWGYETQAFVEKLNGLSDFDGFALSVWASAFWTAGHYKAEVDGSALEAYLK